MDISWRVLEELGADRFAAVRRQTIFDCCKWDPQVEDVATLAPFPFVLKRDAWLNLSEWAERLAREALLMEGALLQRPELHRELGLPRAVCTALRGLGNPGQPAASPRVMRFDFHFTTEGWRISEANTDVPGGFNEASGFTRLMAGHYPGTELCGDPAQALADAIRSRAGEGATVALIHATGFIDDRQVMTFLGRHFERCGLRTVLAGPDHLRWRERRAFVASDWFSGPVDFVFRFFPGEWLPQLPRPCGWPHLFGDCDTPLCNPATALLTQSKRLPLVWDRLGTSLVTWRQMLPETRDVRDVTGRAWPEWVLKPVLGRVGDSIGLHGATSAKDWTLIRRSARWHPRAWVAQRRFEVVPIETAAGPVFPCLGVYTIGGRAAGVYGRIARNGLIDYRAQDIAVLKECVCPVARESRVPSQPAHDPAPSLHPAPHPTGTGCLGDGRGLPKLLSRLAPLNLAGGDSLSPGSGDEPSPPRASWAEEAAGFHGFHAQQAIGYERFP